MVVSTAIARLRTGATMASYTDAHPDVAARALQPPIVIIGGWRTGTTFLYRLLATDSRLRGPVPSELAAPTRVAQLSGLEKERFLDASSRRHDMLHFLNPQLQAVHDSGPRLPEECVLAMGTDLRNWGFTSTVRLDSYARWLAGQSMAGSYQRYRRVLQLLDEEDGRRWVIKAPAHTAELAHLATAFPGAVVVWLHRDIVETIASGSSLFAVFRSMYSDDVDAADIGRYQTDTTELWLRRANVFRSEEASRAVTFVDVDFPRLVSDPVGVIGEIYAAAGMETPADPHGWIERYHDAFPRHAHGRHGTRQPTSGSIRSSSASASLDWRTSRRELTASRANVSACTSGARASESMTSSSSNAAATAWSPSTGTFDCSWNSASDELRVGRLAELGLD